MLGVDQGYVLTMSVLIFSAEAGGKFPLPVILEEELCIGIESKVRKILRSS
jgi:hypothetical protein